MKNWRRRLSLSLFLDLNPLFFFPFHSPTAATAIHSLSSPPPPLTTNQVERPDKSTCMVLLPARFHKKMWIKRGGFLLIRAPPEAAASGARVAGEVERVLYEQEVSELKKMEGVWPREFEEGEAGSGNGGEGEAAAAAANANAETDAKNADAKAPPSGSDSDDSGLPPLEENPNRQRQTYASSSSSESESDSEGEEEEDEEEEEK